MRIPLARSSHATFRASSATAAAARRASRSVLPVIHIVRAGGSSPAGNEALPYPSSTSCVGLRSCSGTTVPASASSPCSALSPSCSSTTAATRQAAFLSFLCSPRPNFSSTAAGLRRLLLPVLRIQRQLRQLGINCAPHRALAAAAAARQAPRPLPPRVTYRAPAIAVARVPRHASAAPWLQALSTLFPAIQQGFRLSAGYSF